MASLVVGVIGAGVGSFFGPLGTSIGWTLGSALENALFPTKASQVPHDLHIQGSSYGAFRKIIYGTVRISGNVIWETDLQEHDGGGKGKTPEQQTFTASFDVGLCETQVIRVLRFWAAGRLNYDVNQTDGPSIPFVLYDGNATQLVDPTEEATEGVGNVPAYRGVSRVVFTDWDMTQFGNSIPQLSFEVQTKAPPQDLRIVTANYATGYNPLHFDRSELILEWTDSSIVVSSNGFCTTSPTTNTALQEYYDPVTFAALGTHVPPPVFTYPNIWVNASPNAVPVGNYVYADESVTTLWAIRFAETTSSASLTPIMTSTMGASGTTPEDNAKFLHVAGVPDGGVFLIGAALSQDNTQLFIFTGPTTGGNADTWYKIVDGLVAGQGTISPSIRFNIWGCAGIPGASPHVSPTASFENNGRYMWAFNPTNFTTYIYYIDDAGNLADWGGGTLQITDGDFQANGFEVSIKVLSDGYAGLATGDSLVKLSRFGPDEATFLDEVVADLCDRAGLDPTQYDVTQLANIVVDGYVIETQMTCRAAIESLMPVYFFDAVESDGVVKFVLRGSEPIVTFAEDDLAAHMDSDSLPSVLSCVHTQDVDLPSQISISYMNKEADYQINTQTAQRMVGGSRDVQTVQVPLVLTDEHAKKIVDAWLFNAWWERDAYTWYSSRKYAKYEPTDVVIVQGITIRITSKNEGATGVIKWEGVPSRAANYVQAGAAGAAFNPGQTLSPTAATQLIILDIPLVADAGLPNGFYAAMAPAAAGSWPGAALFKSSDGTTYTQIGTTTQAAVIGTVSNALGDFRGGNVFDEGSTFTVTLSSGELASVTALDVLNGSNEFLIGGELLQARDLVLIAPSTYLGSGLLRGRRGTEFAIANHGDGEQFVGAPILEVDAPFSELGQLRYYKAVTAGQSLASAAPVQFVNYGAKLRPYSPAQLGGGVDASGNVTINAHRRTRVGGAWIDFSDVILGESTEGYVLQIWSEHFQQVARIVTGLTSPTFNYTTSMITADFGAAQLNYSVSLAQVGSYTLGAQATAVIPGTGGSNNAPLTPVTPYNNPPPQTGTGCSGTVVNTTIDWATHPRVFSGDDAGGPGWTWVIKFTTGSVASGGGRIQAYAGSGDQLPMGGTFTNEPCGFPLPPTQTRLPVSSLVPFRFYMTGNPDPGTFPTLLPSTAYYLCITRPSVGAGMSCDLFPIL
jgi:hypothetical protein